MFARIILFACLAAGWPVSGFASPSDSLHVPQRPLPQRYVNDLAGVLDSAQASNLERQLKGYASSNPQEIAILILDSVGKDNLQDLAQETIKRWRIGYRNDEKGALILVDMKTEKVVIGVGDGLQHQLLPSQTLKIVQRDIIPSFAKKQYYAGLSKCITGIEVLLYPINQINAYTNRSRGGTFFILAAIVLALSALGYVLLFGRKKGKSR